MTSPATDRRTVAPNWKRYAPALASVALLALSATLMSRELRHFRYHEIATRIHAFQARQLIASVSLTLLVYCVLPLYDTMALKYVRQRLPQRRVMFASVVSYAISQTLGMPALTGGGVRYRFWSSWGVGAGDIARAVGFVGFTFGLGLAVVSALALLAEPTEAAVLLHVAPSVAQVVGLLLLALVATYLVMALRHRERVMTVGPISFSLPRPALAIAQTLVPLADWLLAAAVLYVLLPHDRSPTFLAFVAAFVLAQSAGILSNVPGGAGVFETVMLLLLQPAVRPDEAIGALIVYRAIYYLLPFLGGVALLAFNEARLRQPAIKTAITQTARFSSAILPRALAAATLLAGLVLLVSGATPSVHSRLTWLDDLLPLGVIELSHFAGSLVGVALVLLAWALWHRLDAAWGITVALLTVGALTALVKGLDWEEATALMAVLALLLPARRAFYRKGALLHEPLEPGWVAAVVVAVGASIWLGVFAYKHVEFQGSMWWQFTTHGDAPRFMRAEAGVLIALAVFGFMRLLRHSEATPAPPTADELSAAREIARSSADTTAYLALLGDKNLLFSPSRDAMIMYGVKGRSWIALGDPLGAEAAASDLVWRFSEMADKHGGWPVFYETTDLRLPLFIDLGLSFVKLGEEALIGLSDFSLDGPERRVLRRTEREFAKRGATFEMLPPEAVPEHLPTLRRISDDWLQSKRAREKGFSLGRFDDAYLSATPVAIVRDEGDIVAFANVWLGAPGTQLSADLMRYSNTAPKNVMEYLFIQLLLWGRQQGYAEFSLGMAPLSGLANRALAPFWSRAGSWLFRHGENFYNFQGLRQYKEKFAPRWRPRYLASPGGVVLPRVVANVTSLIGGGVKGLVMR